MKRVALFVPLGIFILLVIVLAAGFGLDDPHKLPFEREGDPLPEFALRDVNNIERTVTSADLLGEVSLLNVWATWCPSCVAEHQQLLKIADEGVVRIIGINYNDDLGKAQQWLRELGNPYWVTVADYQGQLAINLGVYGAPETYVMDADGIIHYRHVGAVTRQVWQEKLRPLVMRLRAGAAASGSGG